MIKANLRAYLPQFAALKVNYTKACDQRHYGRREVLAWSCCALTFASISAFGGTVRQSLASSKTFTQEGTYRRSCSRVRFCPSSFPIACPGLQRALLPSKEQTLSSCHHQPAFRERHSSVQCQASSGICAASCFDLHFFPVTLHACFQAAGTNEIAQIARAAKQVKQQRQQQQQQQQQQQTASASDQPKEYLYEPRFGLPLVRRRLSYGELLREIRTENVKQLKFFETADNVIELEGPCLVVFKDDTLAQGYVPHYDYRIPYAMENHGVAAARLPAEPAPGTFTVQKMWDKNQQKVINYVIPVIAIGLVYLATQLAAKWKVRNCC